MQPFLDSAPIPKAAQAKSAVTPFEEQQSHLETMDGGEQANGNWHISLRFGADSLRNGMDPLAFIRFLTTLGEIVNLTAVSHAGSTENGSGNQLFGF